MSFMAVAYVPAFLEDRATFVKERANGLYGATAFMISNFLIGLPYLCEYYLSTPRSQHKLTIEPSLHCRLILRHRVLAFRLPTHRLGFLHMDHVALPRPCRGRIPRSLHGIDLSQLRHLTRARGLRQRPLDVR